MKDREIDGLVICEGDW